jgi:cytochrome c556
MKLNKKILGFVALIAVPAIAAAAVADVIKARQANFKKIGGAFKAINDELKKSEPSVAVLRANANVMNTAAIRNMKSFPKGSGPASGIKTAALPAIWVKPVEFKVAGAKFIKATGALKKATASGDLAAIRGAAGGIGMNCKGCHDEFKAKN